MWLTAILFILDACSFFQLCVPVHHGDYKFAIFFFLRHGPDFIHASCTYLSSQRSYLSLRITYIILASASSYLLIVVPRRPWQVRCSLSTIHNVRSCTQVDRDTQLLYRENNDVHSSLKHRRLVFKTVGRLINPHIPWWVLHHVLSRSRSLSSVFYYFELPSSLKHCVASSKL